MIANDEVKNIFLQKEALLEGHFQLTSGKHSANYLQCAKVLQYTDISEMFGEEIAGRFKAENPKIKIDAVCAPAIGGIIAAHVIARAFKCRAIFAEREGGAGPLKLRRGFEIQKGENILAVEDVITTGGSLKETVDLIKSAGGNIAGVAAVAERGKETIDFGVKKFTLLRLPIEDYAPENCPLCKKGIPVMKPGSRKI